MKDLYVSSCFVGILSFSSCCFLSISGFPAEQTHSFSATSRCITQAILVCGVFFREEDIIFISFIVLVTMARGRAPSSFFPVVSSTEDIFRVVKKTDLQVMNGKCFFSTFNSQASKDANKIVDVPLKGRRDFLSTSPSSTSLFQENLSSCQPHHQDLVMFSSLCHPRKLKQIQRLQSLLQVRGGYQSTRSFSSSSSLLESNYQKRNNQHHPISSPYYTTVVSSHTPSHKKPATPLSSSSSSTQSDSNPLKPGEEANPSITSQSDISNEYMSSSSSPASSSSLHGSSSPPPFSIPSQQEGEDPLTATSSEKPDESLLYGARNPKEASDRATDSIAYANEQVKSFPGALSTGTATSAKQFAQAAEDIHASSPASSKKGGRLGGTLTFLASLGLLGGGDWVTCLGFRRWHLSPQTGK